jgi:hypothetical protein
LDVFLRSIFYEKESLMSSSSAQSKASPSFNNRQNSSTATTITLSYLPKDLLATILVRYCDGYTLNQFWLAVVSCKSPWDSRNANETFQDVCRIVLRKCLARRRQQIVNECERVCEYVPRIYSFIYYHLLGDEDMGITRFNRQISRMCFMIDYCERIPLNVVWCGKLSFRDPRHEQNTGLVQEEEVKVALFVDPRQWIGSCGNFTSSCFSPQSRSAGADSDGGTTATVMILQNYNFVPIAPHGRIVGITTADRSALQRLSHLMNRCDLVGTLPSSYRDRRTGAGSFVCRMISFAQAQRRIERTTTFIIRRFYDDKSKMTTITPLHVNTLAYAPACENDRTSDDFDIEMDKHSLYCSWEHFHHGDDHRYEEREVGDFSIFECYHTYCHLHGMESFW